MQDFEKLGVFYLGKEFDLEAGKTRDDLLLYESKDLTTHAVCVGMTGSGKTGLCLGLLEEAALDGIPAIAIDPKGDLGNLLLAFPELKPSDFQPWVDPAEAVRKGLSVEQYAERTATQWKDGLASWGEDGARIARYKDAVDLAIYTPGSSAGLPLTVLRSFAAPSESVRQNTEALRERVAASVSGLLALLGIDADPLRSREHILLANLLDHAWREGRDLDMTSLVREIQQPPFDKVGVMDLESFFSAKDRFALAMSLNNLLASPGFSAWMEGEPLDIQRLLYTTAGKPRLSVISIAHLSDAERMFFLTILLGEVVAWMRSQSGTSSLRAILYMDEVFGYFPPSANPPTKTPMLTLLKQARAYGLGVVLATQNPVDLDYKGLSNAGTWFLGRLQTERDKARVLDGLEGASAAAGAKFDRQRMEKILSGLGSRVFLMNNVHEDTPQVFQTRWTLSYLRGPLTREQISTLMATRKAATPASDGPKKSIASGSSGNSGRPVLPPGMAEVFVKASGPRSLGSAIAYRPWLLGTGRVHFVGERNEVDDFVECAALLELDPPLEKASWERARLVVSEMPETLSSPEEPNQFASLPTVLTRKGEFDKFSSALKDYLNQTKRLKLFKCELLDELSKVGETESDFRTRIADAAKQQCQTELKETQDKFGKKRQAIEKRKQEQEQRIERAKSRRWQRILLAIWRFVTALPMLLLKLLPILLGQKPPKNLMGKGGVVGTRDLGKMTTAGREMGQAWEKDTDVRFAQEKLDQIEAELQQLAETQAAEEQVIQAKYAKPDLSDAKFLPRKPDTTVSRVVVAWLPYEAGHDGQAGRTLCDVTVE